jgi:hypothetical protein
MARPVIPPDPTTHSKPEDVRAWQDARRRAFIWDAQQAGFSEKQAEFLWEAVAKGVAGVL